MFSVRLGLFSSIFLIFCLTSAETGLAAVTISSSRSIHDVTIDGKWTTTNEWSDTTELQARGRAGYVCIKDDDRFLYVLMDFTSDTGLDDGDLARVRFDVNDDKSQRPQVDDYVTLVDWMGGVMQTRTVQGSGTGWVLTKNDLGAKVASTNDPGNDPYSDQPHRIYEFAVPRTVFGDRVGTGFSLTMGDKMRTSEANFINLPRKHNYLNPSTWATLKFATPSETATVATASTQTTQTLLVTRSAETPAAASQGQTPILAIAGIVAVVAIIGVYYLRRRSRQGARTD